MTEQPNPDQLEANVKNYEAIFPAEVEQVVREQGMFVGMLGADVVRSVQSLIPALPNYHMRMNRGYGFELLQSNVGEDVEVNTEQVWQIISGAEPMFKPINSTVNYFQPGNSITKHADVVMEDELPVEITEAPLSTGLTFIYVVNGEKDIELYLDGEENPPTTLHQIPGMVLAFPALDIADNGEIIMGQMWHAVPEQDTTCTTFTWTLEAVA